MRYYLITSFFLLFMLLIPSTYSSTSYKDYTFTSQTKILSEVIFPEIKSYIQRYDYEPTSESSIKLANDVSDIIDKYNKQKYIRLVIPCKIEVLKFENELNIVYILQAIIILSDQNEGTDKFEISYLIVKKFLIRSLNKNQVET
jgi:hypothetical protein